MQRKIYFKTGALERFKKCNAKQSTKEIIRAKLATLAFDPEAGYVVPFLSPRFYQLQIQTDDRMYVAHYVFDDWEVTLGYVGVLGRC